jgi:methylated-DNA-[protein]-cysteine S-methyltransferase
MILAADGDALVGAWFDGQRYFNGVEPTWDEDDSDPVLRDAVSQLDEYFSGFREEFQIRLAPRGTAFQQKVWAGISEVEFGQTTTYGRLAKAMHKSSAARAVGAATGRNPISIFIPCHRVLGGNGSLTGYAGGIDRKEHLLAHEGSTTQ